MTVIALVTQFVIFSIYKRLWLIKGSFPLHIKKTTGKIKKESLMSTDLRLKK